MPFLWLTSLLMALSASPSTDGSFMGAGLVDDFVALEINERFAAVRLVHRGEAEVASESCSYEPYPQSIL